MRKSNIAIDNSQVSSLIFPAKKRVDKFSPTCLKFEMIFLAARVETPLPYESMTNQFISPTISLFFMVKLSISRRPGSLPTCGALLTKHRGLDQCGEASSALPRAGWNGTGWSESVVFFFCGIFTWINNDTHISYISYNIYNNV